MTRNILAFSVTGIRLGLDVSCVVEVIPSVKLISPPEMPPLLRGFIAMNQQLIPVIRLEKLLTLSTNDSPSITLTDRLVIARLYDIEVAWVADPDMEPITYQTGQLLALPEDHVLNNCASSVLPLSPPVILLDAAKLLVEGERIRLDQLRQLASERLLLLGMETTP